ncbi:MAG: RagB/SusD family nutrient uptake outer membrane protein [Saprospiraceae bacterium]
MKNIKIVPFLALALFLAPACEKDLELNPSQSLSTGEALSDVAALKTALNGAYDGLQALGYYGRGFLVLPETEANLAYLSIANSNRYVASYTYQWTTANGDVTNVWDNGYTAILRANNVINNVDAVPGDAAEKNQVKGEALAIRALVHFDLVRFFAKQYTNGNPSTDLGVPIILTAGIGEPARNTVAEVYAQVVADLTAAKALLRNNGAYRFSPEAAEALLARVYLYKGDWANAEAAASTLIGDSQYALADNVSAMFGGPGSSEEILTLKNEASENRGSDNLGNIYIPAGYGDIRVTDDLRNLYEAGDSRATLIFKHTNDQYYNGKYMEQDGVVGLASPKLIRLAEMYLIRAEARFRQTKTVDALADINTLRTKRGATALMSFANGFTDILHERQRELAFEGHTAFDYWRTNTDMVRNQCGTSVQVSAPCTMSATSNLTVHPIPQTEIDVNQNMVQNEGY